MGFNVRLVKMIGSIEDVKWAVFGKHDVGPLTRVNGHKMAALREQRGNICVRRFMMER
jgi:hypothetical protein